MSIQSPEDFDWAAVEAQFPDENILEIQTQAASEDRVVKLVVEAHIRKIADLSNEDWEWLGKVVSEKYRISRDAAAEAISRSEAAYIENLANMGIV